PPHIFSLSLHDALPIFTAINHPDFHRRYVMLAGFFDEACKLARRRIVFTANAASSHRLGLRLVRWHAFRENTNRVSVTNAVAAEDRKSTRLNSSHLGIS